MPTVSPQQVSPGQEVTDTSVNTPVNQLAAAVNAIDNSNIASNAGISGSKLADNSIPGAKLAAADVDSTRIDFGGAGAGIWWEEIGRTTLASAGDTISIASFTAKKYLMILISVVPTGGTVDLKFRFNNDSGSNYCQRSSTDFGASSSLTSQSLVILRGAGSNDLAATVSVVNIATKEKAVIAHVYDRSTAGAANVPSSVEAFAKWTNTADQITRVDLINGGTGDFAIGSELIVLGHD